MIFGTCVCAAWWRRAETTEDSGREIEACGRLGHLAARQARDARGPIGERLDLALLPRWKRVPVPCAVQSRRSASADLAARCGSLLHAA